MRSIASIVLVALVPVFALACSATLDAPSSGTDGGPAPVADADADADAAPDPACELEATKIREGIEAERVKQKLRHAVVALETPRCKVRVFRADDPASGETVTDDSLWRIGSVTKTYVSATVLDLVAEGKIGLDDTLEKYVPTYPLAARITVRQMLDHTSGAFNYTEGKEFVDALGADPKRKYTGTDLLAFASSHEPSFAPGTSWGYSNTNYVLLGLVIEKATGGSVGIAVRERALKKAGLAHTFFAGEEAVSGTMVTGYQAKKDVTNLYDPSVAWAAGAMVASPSDVLAWVHALYGSDKVLSPASKTALLTFVPKADYGLGVSLLPAQASLGNGRGLGHGGSIFGYQTLAYWFEDTKVGVVSIVADTGGDPNPFSVVALSAIAAE